MARPRSGARDGGDVTAPRSDLYDVDHARLVRQVIGAKRKAHDRSFAMTDGTDEDGGGGRFGRPDIERVLAATRRQRSDSVKRPAGLRLQLLSPLRGGGDGGTDGGGDGDDDRTDELDADDDYWDDGQSDTSER